MKLAIAVAGVLGIGSIALAGSPAATAAGAHPSIVSVPVTRETTTVPDSVLATQETLLSVVKPIVDVSDPNETRNSALLSESAEAGFGGISIDNSESTIRLAWKGSLPEVVGEIVRAAPPDVAVVVSAAKYSLQEERKGFVPVLDASAKLEAAVGVRVTRVDAGTTGAGLIVGYDLSSAGVDPGSEAVTAAIKKLVDAPVVGAARHGAPVPLSTRQADATPWHGGAMIEDRGTGGLCTNGFPVTHAGLVYMLTAGHCINDAGSSGTFETPAGAAIGSWGTGGLDVPTDSLRYRVGSTSKYLFAGGWQDGNTIALRGRGTNTVGIQVCVSGAVSGIHCYAKISQANFAYPSPAGNGRTAMTVAIEAQSTQKPQAIGVAGDSGGPIYQPINGGSTIQGDALGMVSTGDPDSPTSCSNATHYLPGDARCYSGIIWPSITGVLSAQDATLAGL